MRCSQTSVFLLTFWIQPNKAVRLCIGCIRPPRKASSYGIPLTKHRIDVPAIAAFLRLLLSATARLRSHLERRNQTGSPAAVAGSWMQFGSRYTCSATTTMGISLDNIAVVSEPSALVLAGLALFGIAAAYRRK